MTPLQQSIKHYREVIRTSTGNSAHYALGALDVLVQVKRLRDQIKDEMAQQWIDRAGNGLDGYYRNREMVNCLDNITIDAMTTFGRPEWARLRQSGETP